MFLFIFWEYKRASDPLGLELQMVVNQHVGAGKRTQVVLLPAEPPLQPSFSSSNHSSLVSLLLVSFQVLSSAQAFGGFL